MDIPHYIPDDDPEPGFYRVSAARTDPDSAGAVTLVLQTDYPDSASYTAAEEHFQPMMRELRPDGPNLLNAVPRSEFVRNRSAYVTRHGK